MSNSHTVALECVHKNADGRKEEIATQDADKVACDAAPCSLCVCDLINDIHSYSQLTSRQQLE